MGVLDWFRGNRPGVPRADEARAGEALERIIQLNNPRLRFARRYRARLIPAVLSAMEYAHALVAEMPPARTASRGGWSADNAMRAFFATPKDLALGFSRSPELRSWFAANPAADLACAVLSMQLVERRVLSIAVEDGMVRRDVPQTTVSFADHRARLCAATEPALRQVIERRIVDQLALLGLGLAAHDESRREVLGHERALLKMRLKLLEAQGVGLTALGTKTLAAGSELARAYADLAVNEANLRSIASGADALDYQLERLHEVLVGPQAHLFVSKRRMRLDRMNVLLADESPGNAEALDLQIARVPMPDGPPELRAFVLARFARAELLPQGALFSDAARVLSIERWSALPTEENS